MTRLILASASPRRRQLLSEIVSSFDVVPSRYEECSDGISPADVALRFAEGKAREVFSRYSDCAVLGADTVVLAEGKIFGKPTSVQEAAEMLRFLSGRTHTVITGVCLIAGGVCIREQEETAVTFYSLTEEQIAAYIESGSPMDKAGAYGIQDGMLVKSYKGSYTNVVGLPVERVRRILEESGLC